MENKDKILIIISCFVCAFLILSISLLFINQHNKVNFESSYADLLKCRNDTKNSIDKLSECQKSYITLKENDQSTINSILNQGFTSGCLNGCQKVIDKAKAEKDIDLSAYMNECQTYCRNFTQ